MLTSSTWTKYIAFRASFCLRERDFILLQCEHGHIWIASTSDNVKMNEVYPKIEFLALEANREYFGHVDEVHGNGNRFFSPYTPDLAQLVPGFSTPRPIHEIRFEKAPETTSERRSRLG